MNTNFSMRWWALRLLESQCFIVIWPAYEKDAQMHTPCWRHRANNFGNLISIKASRRSRSLEISISAESIIAIYYFYWAWLSLRIVHARRYLTLRSETQWLRSEIVHRHGAKLVACGVVATVVAKHRQKVHLSRKISHKSALTQLRRHTRSTIRCLVIYLAQTKIDADYSVDDTYEQSRQAGDT